MSRPSFTVVQSLQLITTTFSRPVKSQSDVDLNFFEGETSPSLRIITTDHQALGQKKIELR